MAFWIAALVLASAAAAWVALGVGRGLRNNNRAISADEDAARARLSALERDLAQDLISAEAAKAARLEIGRALARAKAGQNAPLSHGKTPAFLAIAGAGVAGLGAFGLYFLLGAPGKPDAPYALRLERIRAQIDADITANPDNPGNLSASPEDLILFLEHRAASFPQDPTPLYLLGQIQTEMGREKEAVSALTAALARASANPFLMSALGAALVRRDNGVTAQARTLFENALGLDPSLGEPKFFFGMAALQAGDNEAAREWWTKAAQDLPENDPRRSMAAQFLARETPPIAVQ